MREKMYRKILCRDELIAETKTKLRGFSPQVNISDRTTTSDKGVSRGQRNGSPRPLISVF
jgi:hypothetical protein